MAIGGARETLMKLLAGCEIDEHPMHGWLCLFVPYRKSRM
jgi:hypothetical protein